MRFSAGMLRLSTGQRIHANEGKATCRTRQVLTVNVHPALLRLHRAVLLHIVDSVAEGAVYGLVEDSEEFVCDDARLMSGAECAMSLLTYRSL